MAGPGESLGTARLSLTVDLDDYEVRMARARSLQDGLGESARAAFDQSNTKAKAAALSLLRYETVAGQSADKTKLLRAAMQGVDPTILKEVEARMDGVAAATALAAEKARQLEQGRAFEKMAADAERTRRLDQAVAALVPHLQQLEAAEAKLGAQNSFVASLQQQAAAIGKTRAELLEMKAAELGVQNQAAPFIAQLKAQERALMGTGAVLDKYGLSAKQTAAALRGVPAQLTDIFVSLQGGQNPLTVLLQQGGQLKDMFGGIGPAFNALFGSIVKLVGPATLVGGSLALIGYAAFAGEKEVNKYRQALALTGDAAGVTVSQLDAMAEAIAGGAVTQGKAAEVVAAVAKSGKFTADQLNFVAETAVNAERVLGQSIDTTIEKFASLANDPVNAVAKLNAETHFLTETTFQQIKALQEQGNEQAAAARAMEEYANTLNGRMADVEENLGTLQTAWRNLAAGAKFAWDTMLNIGREDTVSDKIADLADDLDKLKTSNLAYLQYGAVGSDARKAVIENKKKELQALLRTERDENRAVYLKSAAQQANDYAIAQDRQIASHGSSDDKRARQIKQSRAESNLAIQKAMTAGNGDLAATIKKNQKLYEDALNAEGPKKKSGAGAARSLANAEASAALQALKDNLAEEQAAIQNSSKTLQAEYGARLVSIEDYYSRSRDLLVQNNQAQEHALSAQIKYLRERDVTGKDSVNTQKQIGELESKLARVRADGATAVAILGVQEEEATRKRTLAIEAYKRSLDTSTLALQRQQDAAVARIGMGEDEYQQQQRINQVYQDQADKLRELAAAFAARDIDKTQYDAAVDNLQVATDEQVRIVEDGYVRMKAAQDNWLNGVSSGVKDWVSRTSDVASQVASISNNALDGASEALANWALTGKLSVKDFLADIGKEIVKFMAKQAVLAFVKYFFGDGAMFGGAGAGGGEVPVTNAKGNVYDTPGLSAYSNKVYNKPQVFEFAKGTGIFAEAGPEAIMPLARGSDGKLGVRATGGGSGYGVPVNVAITTIINSDGSTSTTQGTNEEKSQMYKEFTDEMASIADKRINSALAPNGTLWRAGVRA